MRTEMGSASATEFKNWWEEINRQFWFNWLVLFEISQTDTELVTEYSFWTWAEPKASVQPYWRNRIASVQFVSLNLMTLTLRNKRMVEQDGKS